MWFHAPCDLVLPMVCFFNWVSTKTEILFICRKMGQDTVFFYSLVRIKDSKNFLDSPIRASESRNICFIGSSENGQRTSLFLVFSSICSYNWFYQKLLPEGSKFPFCLYKKGNMTVLWDWVRRAHSHTKRNAEKKLKNRNKKFHKMPRVSPIAAVLTVLLCAIVFLSID